MDDILDYLSKCNFDNEEISPVVRDLFERSKDQISYSKLNGLAPAQVVGIIRAFRYCQKTYTKEILHDAINEFINFNQPNYIKECLKILPTTVPFTDDQIKATSEILLKIVRYDSSLFYDCYAALSQICIEQDIVLLNEDDKLTFDDLRTKYELIEQFELRSNAMLNPNKIIICHISDLHFGRLHFYDDEKFCENTVIGTTRDLNNFFSYRVSETVGLPDFYILTGDIASDRVEDFNYFQNFLDNLPVKGGKIKDRLLIVPGNHDTFWTDMSNDRLESFKEVIVNNLGCRTPFGSKTPDCITRISEDGCPISVYIYEEGVLFLLAVSTYYSGSVEANLIKQFQEHGIEPNNLHSDIKNSIRFENGYFSAEYNNLIEPILNDVKQHIKTNNSLPFEKFVKIAAVHHHFDQQYGEDGITENGRDFRELLKTNGFHMLLHGHLHMVKRGLRGNEIVDTVMAPSLSGKGGEDKQGLNVITIDKINNKAEVNTYLVNSGRISDDDPQKLMDIKLD